MLKLFKRKQGGPYYIRGTVQGQRIYESTGCLQRAPAEALRQKREAEIVSRAAFGKGATITFAEAALTYLETGGEARYMGRIIQHFGPDTLLADIDNAAITDAATALYPNAAGATINRQLITPVAAVVNLAAQEGLTPLRKFKRRKGDTQRTRWATPEEFERILGAAAAHLAPILACLVGTGMRASEALTADAAFWYPATGEIWLPDTKNGHPRMVQMPARSLAIMKAANLPDSGPLFRTPEGAPYVVSGEYGGQIKKALDSACRRAGVQGITPHTLRHTWATWYHAATRDFGGLLDKGGWQNADMAQRYRKIAPADLPGRLLDHGWDFNQPGRSDQSHTDPDQQKATPHSATTVCAGRTT